MYNSHRHAVLIQGQTLEGKGIQEEPKVKKTEHATAAAAPAGLRAWQLGLRRHPRPAVDQVIQVIGVGGSRGSLYGLQAGQAWPGQGREL